MRKVEKIFLVMLGSGLMLSAASCKPSWPNCKTDENCQKDASGQEMNFVCYNQTCVECKADNDCEKKDAKTQCNLDSHRCEPKPECQADADCAAINANFVCRTQKCVPECSQDADCGSGKKCNADTQRCEESCECHANAECNSGYECKNCACVPSSDPWEKVSADCRPMDMANAQVGDVALVTINFDFDKSEIRPDMRDVLDQNVKCMKQTDKRLVFEGHADDRGTQEYNMALGEERANIVKNYCANMGIDVSRISVVSKGENEPLCDKTTEECWDKNRRVEFILR